MKNVFFPLLQAAIGVLSVLFLSACPVNTDENKPGGSGTNDITAVHQPSGFIISNDKFYLNSVETRLKCIGLEAFMPGESPEAASYPDDLDYAFALSKIKQANANAVYLMTGDPDNLQPALFQEAKKQGIYIVLGLWFSAEADDYIHHEYDFQGPYFKTHVTNLIRKIVDKVHNMNGTNYSSQVLYFVLGNEFLTGAVNATIAAHPAVTSYSGTCVSVTGVNAVECFIAEMMDAVKTYEAKKYGETHYVTYHHWFDEGVWPLSLTNRFLDIISYNMYSYWPSFVSAHSGGSGTGTSYQGALEEIASLYTNVPFVVSEFGISVAPANVTVGTNYDGQSNEIFQRWNDMTNANRYIAGCSVHELFDQWWKDDGIGVRPSPDQNEHDTTDREEYFGIIDVEGTVGSPVFTNRPAFYMVSNMFR